MPLTLVVSPVYLKTRRSGSSSVVERHLAKVDVAGSNPVSRSIILFCGDRYFDLRFSSGERTPRRSLDNNSRTRFGSAQGG